MPRRQRIEITILLSLGFIVTGAAVVRTYYIWKGLVATYDETWYAFPLWIMAAVEVDLSIVSGLVVFSPEVSAHTCQICACIPYIRPLFVRAAKPLVKSVSSRLSTMCCTGHSDQDDSYDAIASVEAGKTVSSENTEMTATFSDSTLRPSSPISTATTLRDRDSALALSSHPPGSKDREKRRSQASLRAAIAKSDRNSQPLTTWEEGLREDEREEKK